MKLLTPGQEIVFYRKRFKEEYSRITPDTDIGEYSNLPDPAAYVRFGYLFLANPPELKGDYYDKALDLLGFDKNLAELEQKGAKIKRHHECLHIFEVNGQERSETSSIKDELMSGNNCLYITETGTLYRIEFRGIDLKSSFGTLVEDMKNYFDTGEIPIFPSAIA